MSTWIVGIGTSVIAGLILYFGFGIGKQSVKKTAPYVLVSTTSFYDKDATWIRFSYSITNFGTDVAKNVKTYTQIFIKDRLEFQSPMSACSVIPPDQSLYVRSEDPIALVARCGIADRNNTYKFFVSYDDASGSRYVVIKSLYYHSEHNLLSTRNDGVPKKI